MFNSISPKYDFLNHFLSAGIDVLWRKKAIRLLRPYHPKMILDVATGTADFAIEAMALKPEKIVGIDISEGMLHFGNQKLIKRRLEKTISLQLNDSEKLPFDSNTFDAVIVAFGVRNFENLAAGLANILAVLKPGCPLVILEFSKPKAFPVKQLYNFYSKFALPLIGKLISRDQSAYTYLPESVSAFPEGKNFISILEKAGYTKCRHIPLTFGISSIYLGEK